MDKKYPGDWPERIVSSKQDCPDITGTYNNAGSDSILYLFDSITNEGIFGIHECKDCTVIFGWTGPDFRQLLVALQGADGATLEKTLLDKDKGDYSCKESAILVKYLFGAEIVFVGGIRSGTRKYYLADDGSLVLEDRYASVGHMYIYIPVAGNSTDYARWLRTDAAGRKLATEYEARNLVLAGQSKGTNEPTPRDGFLPESMTGNTAEQWWERFKSSGAHGEPDLKALCKSADLGDYRARREMGYLYYHGLYGVRKDPVLSAMWYGLVESQGPSSFNTGREQLTPDQLTELKSIYINWKPGQCEHKIFGIDAETN